jgi:hypothetical protein
MYQTLMYSTVKFVASVRAPLMCHNMKDKAIGAREERETVLFIL